MDEIKKLQAEVKQFQAWQIVHEKDIEKAHDDEIELLGLRESIEELEQKLQAEVKQLKENLEKYGQHLDSCELIRRPFLSAANAQWECTCGFEQALKD